MPHQHSHQVWDESIALAFQSTHRHQWNEKAEETHPIHKQSYVLPSINMPDMHSFKRPLGEEKGKEKRKAEWARRDQRECPGKGKT